MKMFALIGAMIFYVSIAMQHSVSSINYPHPGVQLPEVKVEISKKALALEKMQQSTQKHNGLI